jgi:uncharacterized membrane protein YphA (DoxX/SURF4 family)
MGLLKGGTEDYSSPLAALPLRLFTGYFFLRYGLHKATGGFGGAALRETLTKWAAETRYGFYVPFLKGVAIPHAETFALLVILGEIAVGGALLFGFATRLFALIGIFMCVNFLLASGVRLISVEGPGLFILLLLTVYFTAAGRVLGLDYLLKGKLPRWAA